MFQRQIDIDFHLGKVELVIFQNQLSYETITSATLLIRRNNQNFKEQEIFLIPETVLTFNSEAKKISFSKISN